MGIHDQLRVVQSTLHAPKSQTNTFGKYKYRSCEDILEAVKPLLNQAGLVLTVSDDMVMLGDRFYVKATASVTSADGEVFTTTAFAREEEDKKGMDASQITGSASSYARKYALNGLFLIDDTKDADTNEQRNQRQQDEPPPQAHQPPTDAPRALASASQRNLIIGLWKRLGYTVTGEDGKEHHDSAALNEALAKKFGEPNLTVSLLSARQAKEVIDGLNKAVDEKEKKEKSG